jgi:hypothetical protein
VWEPRRELVAECEHGHVAPELACGCGIYAAREPEEALRYALGRDEPHVVGRVLGLVALWGRVVEGEHGWRAQRAYPYELELEEVSRRYGVARCPTIPRSRSCVRRSASAIARS